MEQKKRIWWTFNLWEADAHFSNIWKKWRCRAGSSETSAVLSRNFPGHSRKKKIRGASGSEALLLQARKLRKGSEVSKEA